MKRLTILLTVILLGLVTGCTRDPVVKSQKLVESGNKFFERGKYKEASIMYRRALQTNQKNGEGYYRLGLSELKLQRFGDAVAALRRAVDLQPNNVDAVTKLADIYLSAYSADPKRFKNLLADVTDLSESLLKRNPKSFDGLRISGYLAWLNHDLPTALKKFEAANQEKPYQPEMTPLLFQAYLGSKRLEDAEKLAKETISRQKNFSPMYDLLLTMYLTLNRTADAENLIKQKIANNPKQEAARIQLAAFYLITKRPADMEQSLNQLTANAADFPFGHLTVGRFYFRIHDFDRARRQYEEGLKATPKEKAYYQKAIVELLTTQGKFDEASNVVNDVLRDDPKDQQAIAMRSALLLRSGNPEQVQMAINDLQSLVTKSPENPALRFDLGRALLAKGLIDQARVQLEESVRLHPGALAPTLLLARIYAMKGDHSRALVTADQILSRAPKSVEARLVRSNALFKIGELAKAKQELEIILSLVPDSMDAKYQLGYIAFSEKNYKQAMAIFQGMEKQSPNDMRGMVGMIETEVAEGNYKLAIDTIDKELAKDPNRQDLRLALANVLVRAEKFDEAIGQFQQLVSKNQKSPDLYIRLGTTFQMKGDLNNAVDNFRKAVTLAPNNPQPAIRLALVLDGMGRRDQAKPLYEQILRVEPDNPVALNNLAFIKAEEGGDLDQALAYAQRAKQRLPQDPNVSDTLGWIYIKKNLSEDAIRVFRELVQKDPRTVVYRYHLAMALFQKGDRASAKQECDKALQSNPTKEEQGKIHDLMAKM